MAVCTMPPDSCMNHSARPTSTATTLTPMATFSAGLFTAADERSLARSRSRGAEKIEVVVAMGGAACYTQT